VSVNARTPLRAPDVGRMAEIERRIQQAEPEQAELRTRMDVARSRFWAAMARYDDVDRDVVTEHRRRVEFEEAGKEHLAAYSAWWAAEAPVSELRHEWLQLQIVRGFLPHCAVCERTVGPVYFEFDSTDPAQTLCMGCFDWACDHDPESGRRPPSHWVELVAAEARDHENARRQAGEQPTEGHCWHCGEPADDLRGWEPEYGSAQVKLKVASLVPDATQPELGDVCLLCVDHDLELFDRWATIERTLCDPVKRRHERALHRFVMGPAPPLSPIVATNPSGRGAGR
jgi:hypothetical protein